MAIKRTLFNQRPPDTEPGASPWATARVRESEERNGTFVLKATITLSPVDSSPDTPSVYDLSFDTGLAVGWYDVTWINQAGKESVTSKPFLDDGQTGAGGVPVPTTRDVAVHLPTRPKLAGGVTVLDFNDETIPTADQVRGAINLAYRTIFSKIGAVTDPDLQESGKAMIALYAAMLVELGFFPEQVNKDQSPYKELKKLYDGGIAALIEAVSGDGGSAVDDTGAVTALMPSYAYPETTVGDGVMP